MRLEIVLFKNPPHKLMEGLENIQESTPWKTLIEKLIGHDRLGPAEFYVVCMPVVRKVSTVAAHEWMCAVTLSEMVPPTKDEEAEGLWLFVALGDLMRICDLTIKKSVRVGQKVQVVVTARLLKGGAMQGEPFWVEGTVSS